MDWTNIFGPCVTNVATVLLVSITVLQCCLKKKKRPRAEHHVRPTIEIPNSDRSSEAFNSSPGKSRSPATTSPSPTEKSRRKSRKSAEKLQTPGKAEKRKRKKSKSGESGEKEKSKKSTLKRSTEKHEENELEVMSTQPSIPSSSDPDSVGTARIEIVMVKVPEAPVKKQMKRPSKEAVNEKKPSREALAERKPSRELMATGRKPSKELLTDNGPAMKKSENCDNSSAQEGAV